MAYGDSLLDAAMKTYQPVDTAGALAVGQRYQAGQSALTEQQIEQEQQRQLFPSVLAQQQQKTEAGAQALQSGALQLKAQETDLPIQAALKREQAKNSLLFNAISTAPDAATWDEHMRELADQFPEAGQYIGRYSPVLQSRLAAMYGGQTGAALGVPSTEQGLDQPAAAGKGAAAGAGAPSSGALDYQFAQTTPEQRAGSLKNLTALSQGLEQVGDAASWDAMRQKLDAAGIPLMDQLGDYSPIKAASLYQRVQPILQYLQNRVVADQAGIPTPKPAPQIVSQNGSIFSVDPYTQTTKLIGQAQEFNAIQGAFGQPIIYSKTTGQIATPSGTGTVAANGVLGDQTKTGADYLSTLPQEVQSTVKAIGDGRMAPISGYALARGPGLAIMNAVNKYNPDFDATEMPTRAKARADFINGADGKALTAIDTGINHMETLKSIIPALKNHDEQTINSIGQRISQEFGGTAPTNFDAVKEVLATEIVKAMNSSGNAGALGDRNEIRANLARYESPDQLYGVLDRYQDLFAGKLGPERLKYETNTKLKDFNDHVSPLTASILGRIPQGQIQSGANAAPAKTGGTAQPSPQDIVDELRRRGVVK